MLADKQCWCTTLSEVNQELEEWLECFWRESYKVGRVNILLEEIHSKRYTDSKALQRLSVVSTCVKTNLTSFLLNWDKSPCLVFPNTDIGPRTSVFLPWAGSVFSEIPGILNSTQHRTVTEKTMYTKQTGLRLLRFPYTCRLSQECYRYGALHLEI